MNNFSDAKIRGFWAEYKYLGVFFVRLLRQGGWFATKERKGLWFCRKGSNASSRPSFFCHPEPPFLSSRAPFFVIPSVVEESENVQANSSWAKLLKNGLSRHHMTFPSDYQYVKWWRLAFWAITQPSPQIDFQIKLLYLCLLQILVSRCSHLGNNLFPSWELIYSHVGNYLFPLWKQPVSYVV